MKVLSGISHVRPVYAAPVVAIGVFDGVHKGHQHLITEAVRAARARRSTAIVMTFQPHPLKVLRPDLTVRLITPLPYRLKLIEELGVDVTVVVRFTRSFSRLSPKNFIRRYLTQRLRPSLVFVGDDFRFGKERQGTLDDFWREGRRYGFDARAVTTLKRGSGKIGSSRIREFILDGQLAQAGRLLGRPVSLMGRVVRGDRRGRKLGYPTSNLIPREEVLPPYGVYVVRARLGGRIFFGLTNVGVRPSFSSSGHATVETFLFDFHRRAYGSVMVVEFLKRLRDEKTFTSQADLVRQIKTDERLARQWLATHHV